MQRKLIRSRWLVLLVAFAFALVACGGDPGDDDVTDTTDDEMADDDVATEDDDEMADDDMATEDDDEMADDDVAMGDGGEFSVYVCEPQNLITTDSSEVCGSAVLDQIYSGLTTVDYETSEPVGVVATDWETEDNVTWTFNLRDDFTFTNGEAVTAQSFVDAWNFAVDPDNAQGGGGFMDVIEGYDEVVDGSADELSGVTAVDDVTLEVVLSEPFSVLPVMVSYTSFYPLPSEAYEDIDAFQEAPIGNGRYMMDGVWEHDVMIRLVRNEDWPGDEPGVADAIDYTIYSDLNTAYLDVQAGNLDILAGIPPVNELTVEQDFAAEQVVSSESSSFTYLGFPLYQDDYADVDIRRAFSMAIDRQEIIDAIFSGARVPATGVIPPVLAQYRGDSCEFCEYDPETAKELYDAAGGVTEPVTFFLNSGAGHEEWVEAIANQLQTNLGLEQQPQFQSLEFAQYLDLHAAREITGPYRLGWVLSYPSPQYAMEPIYATGRDSNYMEYSNEEFDGLIREANAADTQEEADELYQQAEDILMQDMPIAPLWYETRTTVHSDRVGDVEVDPRTFVRTERVSVNE